MGGGVLRWGRMSNSLNLNFKNKEHFQKLFFSIFLINFEKIPQKKNPGGAVSVHTTIGFYVKRLWIAASVKKICLKCQHFRITISSNYSKNLGKISFKIFSLKSDHYIWLFFWHLLEISDYAIVPKNISKI